MDSPEHTYILKLYIIIALTSVINVISVIVVAIFVPYKILSGIASLLIGSFVDCIVLFLHAMLLGKNELESLNVWSPLYTKCKILRIIDLILPIPLAALTWYGVFLSYT